MKGFWVGLGIVISFTLGTALAAEEVRITGKSVWGDTSAKVNYLEGEVRFVQGSTVITTNKARVDTDRKMAVFEEKVTLSHPEVTIAAETLEYDLKKEVGTFKANVVLERKRIKASPGNEGKDPFKLFAKELYFETSTKNFSAQEGRIEHRDFTGEANLIEYNDQLQELILKKDAHLIRPKGEIIKGEEIIIKIAEKSFRVTDLVSIEFEVEETSESESNAKKDSR